MVCRLNLDSYISELDHAPVIILNRFARRCAGVVFKMNEKESKKLALRFIIYLHYAFGSTDSLLLVEASRSSYKEMNDLVWKMSLALCVTRWVLN